MAHTSLAPPDWLYTSRTDPSKPVAVASTAVARAGGTAGLEAEARKRSLATLRRRGRTNRDHGFEGAMAGAGAAARTPYASRYSDRRLTTRLPSGAGPTAEARPSSGTETGEPVVQNRRWGFKGSLLPGEGKAHADLADLARSGPLKQIRNLVLRNANAAGRDPGPRQHVPARHGTVRDPVPGTTGDRGVRPPAWSEPGDADESPAEAGVEGLSRRLPRRLRPSSAMKRYSMFKMAEERPGKAPSADGSRRSGDGRTWRGAAQPGDAGEGGADAPDPYTALVAFASQRQVPTAADGPDATLGSASDPAPANGAGGRPRLEIPEPRFGGGSSAAESMGQLGVSAANRMGIADPRMAMHRQGMGMIRGDLTVAYDSVREVTAEVRKWCTIEKVSYGDADVTFAVTLMPHFYDGLTGAVARITSRQFDFRCELQPPLFVADMGSMQHKLAPRASQAAAECGPDAVSGDHANAAPQVNIDDTGGAAEASDVRKSLARAASLRSMADGGGEVTEGDVAKHHLRLATRETQQVVDEQFRLLAAAGQHAALARLYHRGLQVRASEGGHSDVTSHKFVQRRVRQLEAFDEEDEKFGDGSQGALRARVYPDVNGADTKGNTPVMQAARHGWVVIVRELVKMGADIRRRNLAGQDALALARAESAAAGLAVGMKFPGAAGRRRRAAELVRLLDDRSLLRCAKEGDLRKVRHLVEDLYEDPSTANSYGMTALHFAVMNKDVEMVKLLAANGADVLAPNNIDQTPESMVLAMPADDKLSRAMRRALEEGSRIGGEQARREQQAVAEEAKRIQERGRLGRRIREYTRGTTAAVSVFPAFPRAQGGQPLPRRAVEDLARKRLSRAAARDGRRPVAARSSGPQPAAKTAPSRSGAGDHSRTVRAMSGRLASGAEHRAAASDGSRLAGNLVPSWERHALDYATGRAKARRVADARRAKSPSARRGPPPSSAASAAGEVSDALAGGAETTAALASSARWEMAEQDGVPGPDSAMFEKWMRMRFGVS